MKLKTVAIAAAALALAVGMTACGGAASTAASSTQPYNLISNILDYSQ